MLFDSPEYAARTQGTMGTLDFITARKDYQPSLPDYVKASLSESFDYSLGVRAWENTAYPIQGAISEQQGETRKFKDEQEFLESEYYRPGVEYDKGRTMLEAQYIAEDYDERRKREAILQAGQGNGIPYLYGGSGFIAGLIGSIPDPINFLVPGGAGLAAKGSAQLASKTTKQVFMASLKPGAVYGAAGNFISAELASSDLAQKGEDLSFQDVMMDTMMGAVLGFAFHTGGTLISRRGARKGIREAMANLSLDLPEGENLSKAVLELKDGDPDAYYKYGHKLEKVLDLAGRETNAKDFVRQKISLEDRMEIARLLDSAIMDLVDGKPVDVSAAKPNVSMLKRITGIVNEYRGKNYETPVVKEELVKASDTLAKVDTSILGVKSEFNTFAKQMSAEEKLKYNRERKAIPGIATRVNNFMGELNALKEQDLATKSNLEDIRKKLAREQVKNEAILADIVDAPKGVVKAVDDMRTHINSAISTLDEAIASVDKNVGDTTPADISRLSDLPIREPILSKEPFKPVAEKPERKVGEVSYAEKQLMDKGMTPEEIKAFEENDRTRAKLAEEQENALSVLECLINL